QVIEETYFLFGPFLAPGAGELATGVGVAQSDGQCGLGGASRAPCHADPSPDEGAVHGEDTSVLALVGAAVGTRRLDVAVPVEQVRARHQYLVEPPAAVVHPVDSPLVPTVLDAPPRHRGARAVTDRRHQGVYPVIDSGTVQLGEDHGRPAVPCGV